MRWTQKGDSWLKRVRLEIQGNILEITGERYRKDRKKGF